MQNFSFEFKTKASGTTRAHHYTAAGNTESQARDVLVAELADIVDQAKAMKTSDVMVANATAEAAPADTTPAPAKVSVRMDLPALQAVAAAEGVDLSSVKPTKKAIVEAITAARGSK